MNGDFDLRWEYDRFGNREEQVANPGLGIDLTVDRDTNRLTLIGPAVAAYDDSGNMTQDNQKKYTFDAEGRITEVRTLAGVLEATYTYDGNGMRVKKVIAGGDTTRYVFSGSKVVAEYVNGAAVNSPGSEYVYAGSRMVATLDSGGTPTYSHQDHLSTRVQTDTNGNVLREFGHQPFGESWYETGVTNKWKFTNYERDSESGLDYATFRFDAASLGRFMSPDPIPGNGLNPQSHNRYGYSLNDPVNRIDPLGLVSCTLESIPVPCSQIPWSVAGFDNGVVPIVDEETGGWGGLCVTRYYGGGRYGCQFFGAPSLRALRAALGTPPSLRNASQREIVDRFSAFWGIDEFIVGQVWAGNGYIAVVRTALLDFLNGMVSSGLWASGSLGAAHTRQVGSPNTDYRSGRGNGINRSLQVVVGPGYQVDGKVYHLAWIDTDRCSPYQDAASFVCHSGEYLGPKFLRFFRWLFP